MELLCCIRTSCITARGGEAMEFILWLLIVGVIVIWPFWRIFTKAGFSGALAILMIIPILNVVMIFYLAFSEWPAMRGGGPPQL
jgi:hypothetical protein